MVIKINNMKFIKENWFKVLISFGIIFVLITYSYNLHQQRKEKEFNMNLKCQTKGSFYHYNKKTNKCDDAIEIVFSNCKFKIENLKEYRGSYGKNQNGYIVHEGYIRNVSKTAHYLNGMVDNIYSRNGNILLAEGYTSAETTIKPNEAIPFKVHALIPKMHDIDNLAFREDLYPWFLTCK